MAINTSEFAELKNIGKPATEQAAPQPQPAFTATVQPQVQPQVQAEPIQPVYQQDGLFNLAIGQGALSRRIPRNRISANVGEYLKSFKKILEQITGMQDQSLGKWDLIVFDAQKNQATMSALIFTYEIDRFVAAAPIFIAETAPRLDERPMNGQNGQYSVPQLPEELYTTDATLAGRVENFVRKEYAGREYIAVPGILVPPEVKPDLDQFEDVLYNILYSVNNALQNNLYALNPNSVKWNLARKKPSEEIQQEVKFNAPYAGVTSIMGVPVRSDVLVETTIVRKDNNPAQNTFGLGKVSSFQLSRVAGFVTLDYRLPLIKQQGYQNFQPQFGYGQPPVSPYACFKPQYVMTLLDNETDAVTLELQLLALASSSAVANQNIFHHTFNPSYSRFNDNHDIGAITLDTDVPLPIGADGKELPRGTTDTKDPVFNIQQFLGMYVQPDIDYFIDVPEMSNLSFVQRLFIDAAGCNTSDPQAQQRAMEYIVSAARNLTDGKFQWDMSQSIFDYTGNRVELGYYRDEKGDMHDLREIDYLWLLNRHPNDPTIARDYMNTFVPGVYREEAYRFFVRNNMYKSMLAGNYEIRGWARRLSIRPDFIVALVRAITATVGNLVIKSDYNVNQHNQRGLYTNTYGGLSAQALNGVFVQGGYMNGQNLGTQQWRGYYTPGVTVQQYY